MLRLMLALGIGFFPGSDYCYARFFRGLDTTQESFCIRISISVSDLNPSDVVAFAVLLNSRPLPTNTNAISLVDLAIHGNLAP